MFDASVRDLRCLALTELAGWLSSKACPIRASIQVLFRLPDP